MNNGTGKKNQLTFRYNDETSVNLDALKDRLNTNELSAVIRFCITYTVAAMSKLDDNDVDAESLGVALGELFFDLR